jgi:hypothetical protein
MRLAVCRAPIRRVFVNLGALCMLCGCASRDLTATGGAELVSADALPYALRVEQPVLPMPAAPEASAQPTPTAWRHSTELLAELPRLLNPHIGGYPPRYADTSERERLYVVWRGLLHEAHLAASAEARSETARFLLAELYRMGHNLGVADAAAAAQREIHACLQLYPDSTGCHFSAVRYDLSVAPLQLDRAEASLKTLRKQFGADFNEEVERGFVFLSIYRGDMQTAVRRIDDFVAMFPHSPWVGDFQKLREAQASGKLRRRLLPAADQ